jgi:hypothetical protein
MFGPIEKSWNSYQYTNNISSTPFGCMHWTPEFGIGHIKMMLNPGLTFDATPPTKIKLTARDRTKISTSSRSGSDKLTAIIILSRRGGKETITASRTVD